jgi:hypothetical protein
VACFGIAPRLNVFSALLRDNDISAKLDGISSAVG